MGVVWSRPISSLVAGLSFSLHAGGGKESLGHTVCVYAKNSVKLLAHAFLLIIMHAHKAS